MKKQTLIIAIGLTISNAFAQIPLDVKTIDLSANGKNKRSRFVIANFDKDSKEVKLTFNTTDCEAEAGAGIVTFYGVNYNFEHLKFDENFQFKTLEKESVLGLGKALGIAPVLGKDFDIKEPFGYINSANREGSALNQMEYQVKLYANTGKYLNYCSQRIVAKKTGVQISLKGEGALYNHSRVDDVVSFAWLSPAGTETATVFIRIFAHDGTEKLKSSFDLPYKNFAATSIKIAKENGGWDYAMILQPTSSWNKYGVKIAQTKTNPQEFEYVRIDGSTLQVKERFTFTAANTQWFVEQAVEKDGALYLLGQSSSKVEMTGYSYGAFSTIEAGDFGNQVRIDKLQNYQIMKVKDGKMEYINAITPADMAKVQTAIAGTKGSNEPNGYFRMQELKFVNDKMYITGQYNKPGTLDERKQEFMMIVNESGKVSNLFFVPKKNYANSNMFVSGDKKTMFWAIYDYSNYEIQATKMKPVQISAIGFLEGGTDHAFLGARSNDDGPELQLVKIDLASNTPSALQICGKEEYTLFDDTPVLYSNDTEVVFFGVAGKNKERVAKVIKAKF